MAIMIKIAILSSLLISSEAFCADEKLKAALKDFKDINNPSKSSPCPTATAPSEDGFKKAFQDLDISCAPVQAIITEMLKDYPSKLPDINFDDNEKKLLKENQKKVEELEDYLVKNYPTTFNVKSVGWHGRGSIQRAAWQDPKVQNLLRDPALVRAMIYMSKKKVELDLGAGTLSSLIFFGLSSTSPSYLTSVTPNWNQAPKVKGVSWDKLADMNVSILEEDPQQITSEDIQTAQGGCLSLEKVLSPLVKADDANIQMRKNLIKKLDNLSSKELYSTITKVLDKLDASQIAQLVSGKAGKSTEFLRMNGQALEVMSEFDNLAKYHINDYSQVLGYGLVSHAFDVKHLIAAMYGIKTGESTYRKVLSSEPQDSLKTFLQKFSDGKLDSKTSALMTVRLKEVLLHIYSSSSQIKVESNQIF